LDASEIPINRHSTKVHVKWLDIIMGKNIFIMYNKETVDEEEREGGNIKIKI
jgi:hypothetical protein